MKRLLYIIAFTSFFGYAQETPFEFNLLRQQDEIHHFQGRQQSFSEKLKWISLGETAVLSLGGSYRFQTEGFINQEFDKQAGQDDIWILNRLMFHADLRWADDLQVYAELNSSNISGKDPLSPVDRDDLAFNQLFLRYRFDKNWEGLLGRQNMRLGSGRLIDIREGPNVRLSFDMAQLSLKTSNTAILGFFGVPVRQLPGVFDNDFLNFSEYITGIYGTRNWGEAVNLDAYLLYKREDDKTWSAGTADDNRVSIGLRHFGSWRNMIFDNEFVYQTGDFGGQRIQAWTLSFNVKKPVPLWGGVANLGIKTEAISGDRNPSDSRLNTFDALYPRGAYFGRVARFGPSNLLDLHPYVNWSKDGFYLEVDYDAFWRFSIRDGIYNPALILTYPPTNDVRFIAQQIGSITGWVLNRHLALELETNLIFPGAFLTESNLGDTLFHAVLTMDVQF